MAKTINVFTFEELSKEVQGRIINKWRRNNDYDGLSWLMNKYLEELTRISGLNLEYSLSYNQGDGVCFTGKLDVDDLHQLGFSEWIGETYEVELRKIDYHYSHSRTVDIISDNGNSELENAVTDWYRDICDVLERYGYTLIEEWDSDEYIREVIIDAEEYYTKEGVQV